jgi:heme/copper-type cytochrome/quinol oxidase subunit 2
VGTLWQSLSGCPQAISDITADRTFITTSVPANHTGAGGRTRSTAKLSLAEERICEALTDIVFSLMQEAITLSGGCLWLVLLAVWEHTFSAEVSSDNPSRELHGMNRIIWIIGAIVVVLAILSFLGLR